MADITGNSRHANYDKIINELDQGYFDEHLDDINSAISCINNNDSFDAHVEASRSCLYALLKRNCSDNIVTLLNDFPKIQKALFGLEEDFEKGSRYRDHYVHSFNVFLTGARILSKIMAECDCNEDQLKEILKTEKEQHSGVPFPKLYSQKERLFFLWTLISTFHDIGIPVEHLNKIQHGINKYFAFLGLNIDDIIPKKEQLLLEEVGGYFERMSNFTNLSISPENGLYKKSEKSIKYLKHCLIKEYGKNNHGVVSAICLFNSYIESYLCGDKADRLKTIDDYDKFLDTVLDHDISRAALAIAYHNIKPEDYDKLFPINPNALPLTFMLILCDELQEHHRREGIDYIGITKLKTFPHIAVKGRKKQTFNITIKLLYTKLSDEDEKRAIQQLNTHLSKGGSATPKTTFVECIKFTWDGIYKTLAEKLLFEKKGLFDIKIEIFYETWRNTVSAQRLSYLN
jgi:hypothetical protein